MTSTPVSSAHEAVAVVLRAVEDLSSREQKLVNLHFTVGDANLAVRVELHADEVRATFRTDSPELRAALNTEWQGAAGPNGDRAVRIVPTVTGGSEQGGFNAFSGDASSRQRGQDRSERPDTFVPRLGGLVRAATVAPSVVPSAPRVATPTSRRLHTVA